MVKPTIDQYYEEYGEKLSLPEEATYNLIVTNLLTQINTNYVPVIEDLLYELSNEYSPKGSLLFVSGQLHQIDVLTKPYSSFKNKVYRKNCLNNQKWPSNAKK